jgi:hypothetical protein
MEVNVRVGQIFEFVKSIGVMLRSVSKQALQGSSINKDPTVWLDGALPPPLSTISKIV